MNDELLPPFLWGAGEEPPIKYRLLPHSAFANLGVVLMRRRTGLPLKLEAVHAGALMKQEKVNGMRKLGLWHPERFDPDATRPTHWTAHWQSILSAGMLTVVITAGLLLQHWCRRPLNSEFHRKAAVLV